MQKIVVTGAVKAVESASEYDGTFVLSTETIDRDGDVIKVDGWKLGNFKKNPIALWQHDHRNPVGNWENIRVETDRLVADLKLANTNLANMTRQLIQDGVLKAVSVGFMPVKERMKPIEDENGDFKGWLIQAAELLEASLVSVPANQDALLISKSYALTDDEQSFVFDRLPDSKSDCQAVLTRVEKILSKSAVPIIKHEEEKQMTLSERIKNKQADLVKLRDEMSLSAEKYAEDPSEENRETVEGIAAKIEETEKQLGTLETAEKNIMEVVKTEPEESQQKSPAFVTSVKDYEPGELIFRQATARMVAFVKNTSVDQVMKDVYRNDRGLDLITKASVDPARTDVPAWAGDLLQEQVAGFLGLLQNNSVFGAMRPRGVSLMFDQYGNVKIPSRSAAAADQLAGDFVGEGLPIPVGKLAITSKNVTQRNVKVITTMTREIFDGTMGQIETIIRDAVIEDTTKVMDVKLFDDIAGTAIRPPGLLNGVTPTASSGNTVDNINTDLKALLTPLLTNDAAKDIVIVLNPLRRLGLTMVTNAVGESVFKVEVNSGVLATYPLLNSSNIAADVVHAVNARDFVSAYGGPRFETSTTATLHMEDTDPAEIVSGVPATASPVRSLFQTDTIGLRTIIPMTWDMRRVDQVASLSGVGW